jgi:hypothetical protein
MANVNIDLLKKEDWPAFGVDCLRTSKAHSEFKDKFKKLLQVQLMSQPWPIQPHRFWANLI